MGSPVPPPDPGCAEIRRAAPPYLDGELPPALSLAIEAHRDACPDCAEFLRVEKEFAGLLKRNLAAGDCPAGLARKIRSAIAGERRASALRAGSLSLAALLAVGAISLGAARLAARSAGPALAARATLPAPALRAAPVADRSEPGRVLRGELICIHCRLHDKYRFGDECAKAGHRGALLLPDGDIVYFSEESSGALRRPPGGELGEQVEVEGDYAPREKFIRVARYRVVKS